MVIYEGFMVKNIAFFRKSSDIHQVIEGAVGFSIRPISRREDDLDNFQKIVQQALRYNGSDFNVQEHFSSDYSKDVIDEIYFYPANE